MELRTGQHPQRREAIDTVGEHELQRRSYAFLGSHVEAGIDDFYGAVMTAFDGGKVVVMGHGGTLCQNFSITLSGSSLR